jgi:hypothetical protein
MGSRLLVFVLIVALATETAAQPPPTGSVEGTVTQYGDPAIEALVVVAGVVAVADEHGRYRLDGVPAGQYRMVVYYGPEEMVRIVTVTAGEVTTVHYVLDSWTAAPSPGAPRVCFSNEGCPGWQVCSVSLGDCDSIGSAEVCAGECTAGWLAMAARSQVSLAADDGAHADASIGVEVVPTWLGAHLSFAADWDGGWRLGGVLRWTFPNDAGLGLRVDAVEQHDGWGSAAAARYEWAAGRWRHRLSLLAEVGVIDRGTGSVPFAALGLAGWYQLPP